MEEHVIDLIPGYALDILDDGELLKVARHLSQCAYCRNELASYTQTVDQLALALPLQTPPPDLKAKVVQRVTRGAEPKELTQSQNGHAAAQASAPSKAKSQGIWERFSSLLPAPRLGWALGALALVVLLFLAVSNVLLIQRVNALQAQLPGGNAHMVQLTGTQNAPRTTGYVLVFEGNTYGTLTVDDAPVLGPDQQYQIWLIKDGKRTNGGVFSVNEDGYGVLEIAADQPLTNYQSFGITIEPKGGSPAPTGKKILRSKL